MLFTKCLRNPDDCYVTLPGTIVMVFVMVTVASIFFLLADQLMRIAVSFILGA
jgi:hypothetical protein